MADLSGGRRPAEGRDGPWSVLGRDERRRGRGQLILIAGFALAVAFIALALVLNAAIYTENLATQSESSGAAQAHAYHGAAEDVAVEAFHYANEVNDSDDRAELKANATELVAASGELSTRNRLQTGHVANYSVASTTGGTHISDDGGTNRFRDDLGNQNWTVVTNGQVRDFRVFVNDFNTSDEADIEFVVEGATNNWTLNVSTAGVGVNASGTHYDCSAPTSGYWINVTEGTVDGEHCDGLRFAEGVSGDYALHVVNGSRLDGASTYSLVTDEDAVARLSGRDIETDPVLYSMEVDLVYRTPDLRYRTTIRVAPGEADG